MSPIRWRTTLLILLGWSVTLLLVPHVQAQDERCFPQTGHCISGPFRRFWEQNGGLAVFGYPISPLLDPLKQRFDVSTPYLVQYFERQRFELHPENAPPYHVQLGLLSDLRLRELGQVWFTFPTADPSTPNYFPETGHAIAPEFIEYWQTHGLEFGDPGVSYRESLALFGAPISPAQYETVNGQNILVQWFERARFEHHPNNPAPYTVLLGLLGDELFGTLIDYEIHGVVANISRSDRTITLTEPAIDIMTLVVTDRTRIMFADGRSATFDDVIPQQQLTIGVQRNSVGAFLAVYIHING